MDSEAVARLRVILATMDLPESRVASLDTGWLRRNMAIRNASHKHFAEALTILKMI